jgi:hypothetical protein
VSHTPGPWTIEDGEIHAANGVHVVCLGHDYDDGGSIGATWPCDENQCLSKAEEVQWEAERAANLRLLAAAPDLLFALEIIINTTEGIFTDYRANAEKAIAKAKGR